MLAIQKRLPIPKMVASGMLAFTIGLTASAAYLSTTIERMPYSFNTQQQTSGDDESQEAAAAEAAKKTSDSKAKQPAASSIPVQAAEPTPMTSDWAPYVAPTPPAQSNGATVLPTSGPGASGTVETAPAPVQTITEPVKPAPDDTTPSEPVLQPVTNVVDGLVRAIGL